MKLELKLIYSAIDRKDREGLFSTRPHLFEAKARPILIFVKDFYLKHGDWPDVDTVESKYNVRLDVNTEPVKHWLEELTERYKTRLIEDAILEAASRKVDAVEIFQKALEKYHTTGDDEGAKLYQDDGSSRYGRYDEVKKSGGIAYLSTGEDALDAISMGYRKADLWTLAGKEGSGKTFLLLYMAYFLDMELQNIGDDREILVVTMEMDIEECEERMDAIRFHLPYGKFIRGQLSNKQEVLYRRGLANLKSNIRFVDSIENTDDLAAYIDVYQPAAVFLDGSHLLAKDYDWKELARVTAAMKKITRNKKCPIVNTTHLKSERGSDAKGGSNDDVAYTKGYSRDSDIVGVLFANDTMQDAGQFGIHWTKIRRGKVGQKTFFEHDFDKMALTPIQGIGLTQMLQACSLDDDDGSMWGTT